MLFQVRSQEFDQLWNQKRVQCPKSKYIHFLLPHLGVERTFLDLGHCRVAILIQSISSVLGWCSSITVLLLEHKL